MHIENHLLVADPGDPYELQTKLVPSWEQHQVIVPRLLLGHYGVTDSLDATYRAQVYSKFYAHGSYDGFKEHGDRSRVCIIQTLPFNRRGSHAGGKGLSRWTDKSGRVWDGVNEVAVGWEIANPGPLIEGPDGILRTVYQKRWSKEEACRLRHRIPAVQYKWWAEFTEEESDFFTQLGLMLREAYDTIEDARGHDEVATPEGRKTDPGPAFPMQTCRRNIFPERYNDPLPALGTALG